MQQTGTVIELGLLVVGRIDPASLEAVRGLPERLRARLSAMFSDFEWRLALLEQGQGLESGGREEPSVLLEAGAIEREARHWDFALVVTGADLRGQVRASTLATPSQALAVAVMSTARLGGAGPGVSPAEREALGQRLETLALHCLGHLAGVAFMPDARKAVAAVGSEVEGDEPLRLDAQVREELRTYFHGIADARVEEEPERRADVAFYTLALTRNLRSVVGSIRKTRPWLMPFRLSRLTAAALSTLLVLINTAETWEVSGAHGLWFDLSMAVVALVGMTLFVLHKQRLLFSRHGGLTEQLAVARTVVFTAVGIGLLATYGLLLVLTVLLGVLLYPAPVIANWGGPPEVLTASLRLAGFVAPLGIVLGGLGASFEEQHYVRHLAYVDEEL